MHTIYKYTLFFLTLSTFSLMADQKTEKVEAAIEVKEADLASEVAKDLKVDKSKVKIEVKKNKDKTMPSMSNIMVVELTF